MGIAMGWVIHTCATRSTWTVGKQFARCSGFLTIDHHGQNRAAKLFNPLRHRVRA